MNKELQLFARAKIIDGLSQLPEAHQMIFKRMYSNNNLEADIETVVAKMPDDKLDWAMTQIQNTLKKVWQ